MKTKNRFIAGLLLAALLTVASLVPSCTTRLKAGSNAFVVNAERVETIAASTFDFVLKVDDSNREYFKAQVPEYHKFCEWLRQPQVIWTTNTAPRALAMVINLNNIKDAFKRGLETSNNLNVITLTVNQTFLEAQTWLPVVTNTPAYKKNPVR